MPDLLEVDSAEILVLVDNVTDGLSSTPRFVESERAGMARRGINVMAGACFCCAAHGLSCLITLRRGGEARTLLFDAGPEADVLARNVQRLGADLGRVDAIVLSHGHWDHAGGMLRALDLVRGGNGGRDVPCYVHPGMFRQRAGKNADGTFTLLESVPTPAALAEHGARVVVSTEPQRILDGMAWVSGEIPRVTPFERGLPGQHARTADGRGWEPDELLMDERFVAIDVRGKGVIAFSACSHAGIVNVLTHASASFAGRKLFGLAGGLHLSGTNERIIPETVAAVGGFDLAMIAAGHCTGWRAMAALFNAFGDERLVPLAVGKRFRL